jgi:excisionase family DNA binding protein
MKQTETQKRSLKHPRRKVRTENCASLSPPQVAEVTGYGLGRVYRLLREGIIPHLPLEPGGKGFLVPKTALFEWMHKCGQEQENERPRGWQKNEEQAGKKEQQ